jgi:signal peptidase I
VARSKSSKQPKASVVAQARGGKASGSSGASGRSIGRTVWENFKSLAGAIAIYLVIKTLFVEAFRIPSGSMIPTLMVGDWLFVNKVAYGPHIPFTNRHIPGYRTPARNDIVVFESPFQADNAPDFTPTLVKRLVAIPGDTVYMRKGELFINGIEQRQGFGASKNWKGPDGPDTIFKWQATIAVAGSRFGAAPAEPTHDNWGPILIPSEHYFMMGDNRYCSKDSRYWGIVPRENFRGRPMFVYYSFRSRSDDSPQCNPDPSDRVWPALTDIRWGRIGHWIK